MNTANTPASTATPASHKLLLQTPPSTEPQPASTDQTQLAPDRQTQQMSQAPEQGSNVFLKEVNSATITINTPFTIIPGLPGLSRILARIDRTTNQDIGFTFKLSISEQLNADGSKDWQIRPDYVGSGMMSSKFNIQMSPFSLKVESGEFNREAHWGCSASVLSAPIGFVHERLGAKGTFSDCSSTRSFSAAPEVSYQKGTTFKPLSTATAGLYLGDLFEFRIPAEFVQSLQELKKSAPSMEEWEMMADHIAPSIPVVQISRLVDQDIEIASRIVKSAIPVIESAIESAAKLEIDSINQLTHQPENKLLQPDTAPIPDGNTKAGISNRSIDDSKAHAPSTTIKTNQENSSTGIEPSNEEKATYTVQQNDTLTMIGQKTGAAWTDILALNKNTLKNNPDRIYPGQELLIPEAQDHAALINHPVVLARIQANMANQQESDYSR